MAPPFSPKELEQREKKQLQAVREKFFHVVMLVMFQMIVFLEN